MASITPYDGDRWRAVVRRVGYKVRSQIFDTKRKAETWSRKIENEMDEAKYRDPREGLRSTVRDLMEKFRDEVATLRKGGRWERLRIDLLLRTADFVERRLDQLTPEDIRIWRDARLKQVSGASVNREMNLISGIFTHAIKEWGVKMPGNPMHLVGRPKNVDKHRNRRWLAQC